MNKPEVSVIMPVYNAERYLEAAVKSILNQSFTDFEFIIIDDGSVDKSKEIIKSFDDQRIKFYAREKWGIVEQLNFGIKVSSADIIARMDSDDLCDERKMEIQFNFLKNNKDIDLVGTNFLMIDKGGKIISKKRQPEFHKEIEFMMPVTASILHSTIMVYKRTVTDVGCYKLLSPNAEDHELFLRILLAGYKMYNIQSPLYNYRIWSEKSNDSKYVVQNESIYRNGKQYLDQKYSSVDNKDFSYHYRSGLLEYYRGNINIAKRNLFIALKIKPEKFFSLVRFLALSLLGDKTVKKMRSLGILKNTSILINKYFNKDFHIIAPLK